MRSVKTSIRTLCGTINFILEKLTLNALLAKASTATMQTGMLRSFATPSSAQLQHFSSFWWSRLLLRSLLTGLFAVLFRTSSSAAQRMEAYPSPDWTTSFMLSSQRGQASFKEVNHNLGLVPFRVRVFATPTTGVNKGYSFEGVGSAQCKSSLEKDHSVQSAKFSSSAMAVI